MTQRTPLSNVISAFSLITAMLIEELEKAGVMSREQFATRLRDTAKNAEEVAPDHLKDDPRVDLQIARLLANLLSKEEKVKKTGWNPVVIDGGLDDDQQ